MQTPRHAQVCVLLTLNSLFIFSCKKFKVTHTFKVYLSGVCFIGDNTAGGLLKTEAILKEANNEGGILKFSMWMIFCGR